MKTIKVTEEKTITEMSKAELAEYIKNLPDNVILEIVSEREKEKNV